MNRRVVITGMGAVSPVGVGVEAFWNNLLAGKNGIDRITRFDPVNLRSSLAGEVKDFDPEKTQSPKDASHTDRSGQFALAAAVEAVEQSGVVGTVDPYRAAVYFGTGIGGFETTEANCRKLVEKGARRVSPFFVPMMIANMPAGAIAIRYGFLGQAIPAVTACASGSRSYLYGPMRPYVRALRLALTDNPSEASLPFDKRRGGFVPAEGAGALVLEEYERAKARGAKIFGEIVGYGTTCDAYHMTAPKPDGSGAGKAIALALEEANWKRGEHVYVNAHGTGTSLNDLAETLALKLAFGEEEARKLQISSTKSMTGHMLGAAGAVEAIVCVKALAENVMPPTINLLEPDPECDLDYIPLTKRAGTVELAISNSFGFGGHNACVAIRRCE